MKYYFVVKDAKPTEYLLLTTPDITERLKEYPYILGKGIKAICGRSIDLNKDTEFIKNESWNKIDAINYVNKQIKFNENWNKFDMLFQFSCELLEVEL